MIKRVFTREELLNVKNGSLTYYMASELLDMGAPIRFNKFNVDLKPEDIEFFGCLKDKILQDGSHEFIFNKRIMDNKEEK